MAEEIVMATSRRSVPQEITLKSTHIHRIESGDILVFRLKKGIPYSVVKDVSAELEALKNALEAEHGKKVYFMVMEEGDVNITHYRVEGEAVAEEKTIHQQHPWQL